MTVEEILARADEFAERFESTVPGAPWVIVKNEEDKND